MNWTALHLFSGLGGGALGFERAGIDCVGAVDVDEEACEDFERLTGIEPTCADLSEMQPHELRESTEGRPDIVFTSPPCKSFSGCLPAAKAETDEYRQLSSLAQRGIFLALEAWSDEPPPLIVMENVPRIQTRGAEWLEETTKMLRAYGYAVSETTHDCGELGGLAQHRNRYLLVARHTDQVPEYLYEPPKKRVRGIGEILGDLPVPVPKEEGGGQMHHLPRLSPLNWLRLALIPAGGDWRDLPEEVGVCDGYRGRYGVVTCDAPSPTIRGAHEVRLAPASWADPRVECSPRSSVYGALGWSKPAGTIVGHARHDNGAYSIADPRVDCKRREGSLGVQKWGGISTAVIANASIHNWPMATADPRSADPTHFIFDEDGQPAIYGPELNLESRQSADPVPIIVAQDGCWHRPLTTLELAALQGFPTKVDGNWLDLAGGSHKRWRERIGNAVPPPAAEAIAQTCAETLEAAKEDGFFMRGEPVWVDWPEVTSSK